MMLSKLLNRLILAWKHCRAEFGESFEKNPGTWMLFVLSSVLFYNERGTLDDLHTVCVARPEATLIKIDPVTPQEKADAICNGINDGDYDDR